VENIQLALLSVPSGGISKADGITGGLDVPYSEQRLYKEWGAGTRTMDGVRKGKKTVICKGLGGRGDRKKGLKYHQKEEA